jgi:WD40 repeat protein
MYRLIGVGLSLIVAGVAMAQDKKADLPPIPTIDLKRSEPIEYGRDVEPIFRDKCFVCHTGNVIDANGKYDMSTYEKVLQGGAKRGGKVVVPGKSTESFLFLACSRQTKPIMPPKSEAPLTPQELSIIKAWIDEGAKAPTTKAMRSPIVLNLPPALVRPVRAVAVAPDGKTIAASRGNHVHIYELTITPADKKGGMEKKDWVYARTLSDPSLKLSTGQKAEAAHISLVESMAFSPDGQVLATGSFQELTLWDRTTGQPKTRLGGFADRVTAIAFSADGQLLATGGGAPTEDGEIKVFTATGQLLFDIKNGHSDTVFGVAFSPDGRYLATCGADKFVKVFELPHAGFGWLLPPGPKQPRLLKAFEGHTHHVMGVGWTPDGKKLASCGADNFVKIWDFEKGEKIRDIQGHQKQVTALAFVGKTAQFLTGSGDHTVRLWNADNGGSLRNFPGAPDYIYAVSASPDGEVVASGCEDGVVRVYNGKNGTLLKAAVPSGGDPHKK